MIKPVKMKKLSAVILEEKKDAVLRELKERGVIQLLKVEESDVSEEFDLASGRTAGVNVKAGEYISKIDGILDVFSLVGEENLSLTKKLTQEPAPPVQIEELPPSELFKKVDEKLASLEGRVFEISSRIEQLKKEREETLEAKNVISKLKHLGIGPADIEDFESTFISTGTILTEEIPALRSEISEVTDLISFHSVNLDKTSSVALMVALREFESDIRRAMHIHRFEEFRVPPAFADLRMEDAASEIESKLSQIDEEEKNLLSEIKELKDAEEKELLLMHEALQIEKKLDETNTFFGATSETFLLSGWVPVNRVNEIVSVIESASDNHCITKVEEKTKDMHPPILLNNTPFAKPLEALTNTYGIPSYGHTDPSLFMAISFPIIFGMMFGDFGQGLVLVAVGYLLGFKFKLEEGARKLGRILFYCGIAASFAGIFLYGEAFGQEFHLVNPVWSHPMTKAADLIGFSYYIAIVQLSLGCFINIYDEVVHKKYLHAILSPWGGAGLWFFWGGAVVITLNGISGSFDLLAGLISLDPVSLQTLVPTLVVPMILIVIGGKFVEGLALSWSIYEAYEAFTRFLFNSISYIRIGALAIVHAVFAHVMNMGLEATSNIVLMLIILFIGNTFIIVFETLISFIQCLRLHYYEWFSKFYTGEGEEFEPFTVTRKYTFLAPTRAEGGQ